MVPHQVFRRGPEVQRLQPSCTPKLQHTLLNRAGRQHKDGCKLQLLLQHNLQKTRWQLVCLARVSDASSSSDSRSPHTATSKLIAADASAIQDLNPELARKYSSNADASLQVSLVQWYPGHIAKAERQLKEQLKMVDVVLEVRDARIPVATHHPQVETWVGAKPRILVMNRQDMVSKSDKQAWLAYFKETKQQVIWTDGKTGDGVNKLRDAVLKLTASLNEKRAKRGLQPRPVRACVIGFPNIGKSALINRLLNRKVVSSAPKPGVTRMLQWVRLGGELDLLDAPGVIPASFTDQIAAQRLAICNDIGEAAYVESLIAACLIIRCKTLPESRVLVARLKDRYGIDPLQGTAEDFVRALADKTFMGDVEKSGARLLRDYRMGALGNFALELPADVDKKRMRDEAAAAAELQKLEAAAAQKTVRNH